MEEAHAGAWAQVPTKTFVKNIKITTSALMLCSLDNLWIHKTTKQKDKPFYITLSVLYFIQKYDSHPCMCFLRAIK